MLDDPAQLRALRVLFPSEILWEKNPAEWVSLEEIRAEFGTYKARFNFIEQFVDHPELSVKERDKHRSMFVGMSDIEALITPIGLKADDRANLAEVGYALAGWLMAEQHRKRMWIDAKSILNLLSRIKTAIDKLTDEVGSLPRPLEAFLNDVMPGDGEKPLQNLELLCNKLKVTIEHVRPHLTTSKRGPRKRHVVEIAVHHLTHALEQATGKRVETFTPAGAKTRRLRGELRQLVINYFELTQPGLTETTIALAVDRARKREAASSPL